MNKLTCGNISAISAKMINLRLLIIKLLILSIAPTLIVEASPECSHVMQQQITILNFKRPLKKDSPIAKLTSRSNGANSLCGPTCLTNGMLDIFPNLDKSDLVNSILFHIASVTRRDPYDLENKGILVERLGKYALSILQEINPAYRLTIRGKWGREKATDLRLKDFQLAENPDVIAIALISYGGFGHFFKGAEVPRTYGDKKEQLLIEALRRDFSMLGGRGHFVLVKGIESRPDGIFVQYIDPQKRVLQVRRLTPVRLKRGDSNHLVQVLSLGRRDYFSFDKYKTQAGEPRLLVCNYGEAEVITSLILLKKKK